MKKIWLWIVCVFLFLAAAAGGAAWLYFSPHGALNPGSPEKTMQAYMDASDGAVWKERFCALYVPAVTEFEDAAEVASRLYDAAAGDGPFTFRAEPGASTRDAPVYIVSAGETDLLTVSLAWTGGTWPGGAWSVAALGLPAGALTAETRTVTVTVPSDASVTLNGIAAAETYITDADVPYGDMTELEKRFDSVPHRVCYTIPGLYGSVTVAASRPDGVTLVSADGTDWVYTVPDAGAYSFRVTAPSDAVVTVCGAALDAAEAVSTTQPELLVDIPSDYAAQLPSYTVYEASGLYSQPEITAAAADGTALEAATGSDGAVSFALPGSAALQEAHGALVEQFLTNMCEYGAGHTTRGYPLQYIVPDSALYGYFHTAAGSLVWTVGVTLTYSGITSSDYLALGDDCFFCRAEVQCTTKTSYQTRDLDLRYEMLWVRSGDTWLLSDLAFA